VRHRGSDGRPSRCPSASPCRPRLRLSRARGPASVKQDPTIFVLSLTCSIVYSPWPAPPAYVSQADGAARHLSFELCLATRPDAMTSGPPCQRGRGLPASLQGGRCRVRSRLEKRRPEIGFVWTVFDRRPPPNTADRGMGPRQTCGQRDGIEPKSRGGALRRRERAR